MISRRNFFKISGALTAGSAISAGMAPQKVLANNPQDQELKIKEYRTLGRTGFKVSAMSMGTLRVKESNVIRYAYDAGINYFDNAEGYQNGESERKLGQALKHMDRKKIFLTTKIHVAEDESEESILNRFAACQERMKTEYIDCFYMHAVKKVSLLDKPEFHSAVSKLKSEGRLRFSGLSSHGPRRKDEDSMEKVLTAAAHDGRFDVMLLIYNFMNEKAGNNIIKACKENNVGATAMKTSPGELTGMKYDPANPTRAQEKQLKKLEDRYDSEEEIEKKMNDWIEDQQEDYLKTKPFAEKYGITSEEKLKIDSIRWVINNSDMHAACISLVDFEFVDKIIPYSGLRLDEKDTGFIDNFKSLFNDQYCRHGCSNCIEACPHQLPVSTIMRYAYYFKYQGWEKEAMLKYSHLNGADASLCEGCHSPCLNSCEFQVNIPRQLKAAHNLLTLA